MQISFFDKSILKDSKNIYNGNHSNVFELPNGQILKLFNRDYLNKNFHGNTQVVDSYIRTKEQSIFSRYFI